MTISRPDGVGPMPKDVIPISRSSPPSLCVIPTPLPRGPQGVPDTSYVNTSPQYWVGLLNKELFESFRLHPPRPTPRRWWKYGRWKWWIHFTSLKYITQILRIRCSDSARVCGLLYMSLGIFSLRKLWKFSEKRVKISDSQTTGFRYTHFRGLLKAFYPQMMGMQNIMQIRFNLLDDLPQ